MRDLVTSIPGVAIFTTTAKMGAFGPLEPVMQTIGFASSVLGIINFAAANTPSKPARGATVRIKVGTSGKDDAQTDGTVNTVYGWDIDNLYLGKVEGSFIEAGDIADYTIDSFSGGTRAEYIGVDAGKNAICIAWITVKMFDGTTGGAWTGDVGHYCGPSWYPQHERAGWTDDKQTKEYVPKCTWIDKDHSNKIKSAALKFSSSGYGDKVTETLKKAKVCSLTAFGPDSGRPAKRELRKREPWMEKRLVVSALEQHTAKEVCESKTSWGPDFVGSDGMFCDMDSHTLAPLCSTENVDGCVNINNGTKTVTKRSSVARREVEHVIRSYESIANWL
ncbi:Aspercryptin biosynthesis cluster protein B [Purpureocillium lavendulum]|uniref:Aspercryptin biosynthesis cluster protein B n=1 Tax=Purpureocillium lavendulum TaxID=1247861 RepID=A0AB34G421_9HYPO|nr:Aspercryptin biosynthesis cluster protein B [Purpureocillium lavendulum]